MNELSRFAIPLALALALALGACQSDPNDLSALPAETQIAVKKGQADAAALTALKQNGLCDDKIVEHSNLCDDIDATAAKLAGVEHPAAKKVVAVAQTECAVFGEFLATQCAAAAAKELEARKSVPSDMGLEACGRATQIFQWADKRFSSDAAKATAHKQIDAVCERDFGILQVADALAAADQDEGCMMAEILLRDPDDDLADPSNRLVKDYGSDPRVKALQAKHKERCQ
jgi:hypothetical protein